MRLAYLIAHAQCACNTAHVYLSKLTAPARAGGCCLFSQRDAGSVRINYSPSVDDVVGLQVVAITLRQVTASVLFCKHNVFVYFLSCFVFVL